MKTSLLLVAVALPGLAPFAMAQNNGTLAVNLPFADVTPLAAVPPETSRPALRVTLAGGQTVVVPMQADTWFWKDKPDQNGTGKLLAVRDARFAQILLKPDLTVLPPDARIEKAQFSFYIGWRQQAGGMKFSLHRMLSDWGEDATYIKPSANAAKNWDGMKPGTDFEMPPSASVDLAEAKTGRVTIDGLESLLNGWLAGTYPNYGFALQASGKAIQVNIDSREAVERILPPLILGGPNDAKLLLRPNMPLVRAVPLRPEDLKDATLSLNFSQALAPEKGAGFSVAVYKTLKANPATPPVAGVDYETNPVTVVPLSTLTADKSLRIRGVLPALQTNGVLIGLRTDAAVTAPKAPQLQMDGLRSPKRAPQLELTIVDRPKALLFDYAVKPVPGVYNQMKDGHFNYGGRRLRLWGTLGSANDADRLRKMGFNAWRMWRAPVLYTPESAKRGEPAPGQPGDAAETYDKLFASLKQNGMFVMLAGLTSTMPLQDVAVDGSFVAPPDTASQADKDDWAAWRDAVRAKKDVRQETLYVYFDPRLQTVRKRHAKNFLLHVNPLTGKNYAEDEAIALYETFNESAFVRKVLDGDWDKWHPYFKAEFQTRWNEWLLAKYKDDAGLKAAWGKVDDGETLAGSAVKLGPISPRAADYPAARGEDFIRFASGLMMDFNLDFEKYCRSLAPKGVGINVIPFSFDTQYTPSVQWAYQRSAGQVNCFGMYSWDTKSVLGRPPGNYVMDSHDVEGKATVIYETNQSRPDPYRVEYPFRTAALASWQDWDGVFWHYWGASDFRTDEEYLTRPMLQLSPDHYWTGVHHHNDPAMTEAMAMAGRLFLGQDIAPAPNPAIYEIGAKTLFNFNRYNALGLAQATYSTGSRLRFKPESQTEVQVNGSPPPVQERITQAVKSGAGVLWDWPNERLIIDTPSAKAYIGKTAASYTFKDGITISGFNTPFIAWSLVASDGKPLVGANATQRAYLSGVFDARNTGFDTNWSFSGGPVEQANVIKNRGTAPIVVDKVSYTVAFPSQLNGELAGYDFALRQTGAAKVTAANAVRVSESTDWMNILSVTGRGKAAPPVVDPSPGAPVITAAGAGAAPGAGQDKWQHVFNPIPNLSWGSDYRGTHRILRESPTRFIAISPEDLVVKAEKIISWSGAEVLFEAPADFEVAFENDRMTKIVATFKRPPDFPAAVAAYEQKFGPAVEKVLGKAQFETNLGRWQVKSAEGVLNITLTQSQGEVKARYEFASG